MRARSSTLVTTAVTILLVAASAVVRAPSAGAATRVSTLALVG